MSEEFDLAVRKAASDIRYSVALAHQDTCTDVSLCGPKSEEIAEYIRTRLLPVFNAMAKHLSATTVCNGKLRAKSDAQEVALMVARRALVEKNK